MRPRYEKQINRLADFVRRRGPVTAKQVASWAGISKPAAYSRLRDLAGIVALVEVQAPRPRGRTGPAAVAYQIQEVVETPKPRPLGLGILRG